MKKKIVYSSEIYLLSIADVAKLESSCEYFDGDDVVVLIGDYHKGIKDTLLSGKENLERAKEKGIDYVSVKLAYYSVHPAIGFFINLIKPIKRKFYAHGSEIYGALFSDVESKDLTRGVRNAENAYQWTGKWAISKEEAEKRYKELYDSIKKNGYDHNSPMLILLNRRFGVGDQFLQGHHRMTICKELGIKDVSLLFWTSPKSPSFMKAINYIVTKIRKIR